MITYGMQKETAASIDVATKQAVNSVKKNLIVLQKLLPNTNAPALLTSNRFLQPPDFLKRWSTKKLEKSEKSASYMDGIIRWNIRWNFDFFRTMKSQRRSRTSCNSTKTADRFLHHTSYVCNRTTNSQST